MKKLMAIVKKGGLTTLASLAMIVTMTAASRGCFMYIYQDELPAEAKKLRKF